MDLIPYSEEYKQRLFDFTGKCFEEIGKKFEPSGRHSFYNDIGSSFDVFYCLTDEEKVIGSVALKKIDDDTAELKAMYLDSDHRGKGLGRRLMEKILEEAEIRGYRSIVLDSMSQYKAALKLYEKTGFKQTERYNDNIYADVFMRLDLQTKQVTDKEDTMKIFYVMFEGKPKAGNPESFEIEGGFIDVWVKTDSPEDAVQKAKEYVDQEDWEVVSIEESSEVTREGYLDDPDALECFDEAYEKGISALFFIWDPED